MRTKKTVEPAKEAKYLCAVLIRSLVGLSPDQRKALQLLRLNKKHVCVVVQNSTDNRGMLKTVKDVVAYGEIDEETFKLLQEKRGRMVKDKEGKEIQRPVFNLHPPRGGFERKGIKKDYVSGGALGYRGGAMKQLIERMV